MDGIRTRLMVVAAAAAIALAGCGSATGSPAPASGGGSGPASGGPTPGGTGATSAPAVSPDSGGSGSPATSSSPGPAATDRAPVSLDAAVYALVSDSSGWKPAGDSSIRLIFEPGGAAVLYAASPADALSHHGRWTYRGGSLGLAFTAPDFAVNASAPLGLADATVTLPFQVASGDPGTSTWRRESPSIVELAYAVVGAAVSDPDLPEAAATDVVDEAYRVVRALVDAGGGIGSGLSRTTTGAALAAWHQPAGTAPGAAVQAPGPTVKSITKLENGLSIEFDGSPTVNVPLYNWAADPADPAPLRQSPIASDPRVRQDPETPKDGASDPRTKTAVFIAPFQSGRFYGSIWANIVPKSLATRLNFNVGSHDPSRGFDWAGMQAKLEKHGYSVTQLTDGGATLVGIIRALGGAGGKAPGFVVINTHGQSDGTLATGVDLGPSTDGAAVTGAWWSALRALGDAGLSDLLTFEGGTPDDPETIGLMTLPRDGTSGKTDEFLSLRPAFWRWLAGKGASLDRSLVYMAACLTDATPALREAVGARAYLAWTKPVNPYLAGSVASYLVDDLVRPTHSAEEAFYNIFRVVATRQRIYDYDAVFSQAIPGAMDKGTPFLEFLRGWGRDGGALVPYGTSGMLDRTMNPGNIWWMVFVARWDTHAADGAELLVRCYQAYWKDGHPGGLADEFCNSANPGGTPTADEVAYATYLLTGHQVMPYSRMVVPRLTLADGG